MLALPAAADGQSPMGSDRADWLRLVPGEARFYVEIRDLSGIQRLFRRLGIWQTVRDLTEKDSISVASQPWRHTSEQHLQLTPGRAIHLFLGKRTALIATESSQWQGGVVLAEVENATALNTWLKRWRARPLADEGPVRRYELTGGILLAVRESTLAFGPAGDAEGLWARTVLLMAGRRGPTLAARSEFAALRSRISADHPVMLYVVWPPGNPTAIAGCRRLLLGASVTTAGISCELHGQRDVPGKPVPAVDRTWVRQLPLSTLAVRAASFDVDDFLRRTGNLAVTQQDQVVLLFLRGFLAGEGGQAPQSTGLGPSYCLVFGRDRESSLGFDLPALTLLCQSEDGGRYVDRLDRTLGFLAALLARTAPSAAEMPGVQVKVEDCEGVQLHHVEVGPVLANRTGLAFLDKLDLCWASQGERLILSSSLQHAREIVLAAVGKNARLADDPDLADVFPGGSEADQVVEWWFARGNNIAQMLANWRAYLEREQPKALEPLWWQEWAAQQFTHRTRLGVGLVVDKHDSKRAVVKELSRNSPAFKHLRVGDVIIAAGGAPLVTTQPAQEVAERYGLRANLSRFDLDVIRGGKTIKVTIPVPPANAPGLDDFDPIRGLDQWTALSRCARSAAVRVCGTPPDRLEARILIRWEEPILSAPKATGPRSLKLPPAQPKKGG